MSVRLLHGDCREVVRDLPLVDAVVTDPPYHLTSTSRGSRGFMGQAWDGGDVAFDPATWSAIGEAMKPGAHLVVFGGSRTFHRVWCAVEDAGFEVRDTLLWLYGSGFPKSLNVSRAIDKHLGVEGTLGAPRSAAHAEMLENGQARRGVKHEGWDRPWMDRPEAIEAAQRQYIAGGEESAVWTGWGSAVKPAFEPILLARRALSESSIARNVLVHGTGAINVDGCRIGKTVETWPATRSYAPGQIQPGGKGRTMATGPAPAGRFPPNILHDGSDEVLALFPDSKGQQGDIRGTEPSECHSGVYSGPKGRVPVAKRGDEGSAARFFPTLDYGPEDEEFMRGLYCPKAGKADREGSKHPTVKPQKLMRWLCRLVTPPGGTVLDPFAGSGATLKAATSEGFAAIGCDITDEWIAEMEARFGVEAERAGVADEAVPRHFGQSSGR